MRYHNIEIEYIDIAEQWDKKMYEIVLKLCNWFAPLHPCRASRNFSNNHTTWVKNKQFPPKMEKSPKSNFKQPASLDLRQHLS